MNFMKEIIGHGKAHFTLIDPENQSPGEARSRVKLCKSYGTDAIMIGGSTTKNRQVVDDTIKEIKKEVDLPVILFPNSAESVSRYADYIFFMSLMNSRDYRYLIGEQIKGFRLVKRWGIKPIPMGYIVVSTSKNPTTVERVVELERIGCDDVEKAAAYAAFAQDIWGMSCVYLEAGSGAEKPVPDEMISAVRDSTDIPIIVGGGITDASTAKEKVNAGADVIVNGTLSEDDCKKIKDIIAGVKG
ncbi:MAG: hypothetical protein A7316_05270 [Candidatus Altiarchaeales archaeon WOR_SM1_86-2]|nr:MAG: hypothetical protein A7315_04850 [Candidatus Altiarchaeales archaeon WOR_SM1_79]ODS39520.1 MAG: hypothetical protein A7316_05270 [Candidatus Altiarchaeales archaeon WOR_SM1_86-2]